MKADDYNAFLDGKLRAHEACGIDASIVGEDHLFDHQLALSSWAARKGRAAIFADTGLGKTRIQIAWAETVYRETGRDVLILAPLAVAAQTEAEAIAMGIHANHVRDGTDSRGGINITNYGRLHRFDADRYGAVVLDESSIIKHHDSKTLQMLMHAFSDTPYRLCCTATPAPNDWTELGTHAEFLGVCTRAEMLSEFFVHDGGNTQSWRLKGHACDDFWRWISSWGALVRSPADLGFDGSRYHLPPLHVNQVTVGSDAAPLPGEMFQKGAMTLSERRLARRASLHHRVSACADMANRIREPWVIWCELNAEGEALRKAIPDAVEICGADTTEHKERSLIDFAKGRIRVLVTKPKIAGFGLNWQHCRRVGFVGVTDSWESYYQAVRRCWRFGQKREVHAYLYVSEQEGAVRANLERKERDAMAMAEMLSAQTGAIIRDEVIGQQRQSNEYNPRVTMQLPEFMGAA